jgi:hypothetical protein
MEESRMSTKRFSFVKSVLSLIVVMLTALVLVACGESDQELVDAALEAVEVGFAEGDSASSVTQNLTLPSELGEVGLVWTSGNTNVISNAGVVTRPVWTAADANVTMTVTLTLGEVTETASFTLTVKKMVATDQQVVDAAKDTLAITYATGDTALTVTEDLTLPVTSGAVAIAWSSSEEDSISDAGVVVQGQVDVDVVLTATLTKGTASNTKVFNVKVLAVSPTDIEIVAAAKPNVAVVYATGDTVDAVKANLTLASVVGEVAISWVSSNPAVITNAGVVVRPAYGLGDAVVTLTATLTKGLATDTKIFTITVVETDPTDQELIDEAVAALMIGFAAGDSAVAVKGNLTLATTDGDVTIEWNSDMTAFISNAGVVVRPVYGEDDVTVVLTATLSLNQSEETKEFTLVVLSMEPTDADLVNDALQVVAVTYAAGEDASAVSENVTLPLVSETVTISWSSSNVAIISNAGVVVRPAVTTDVTLTATLTLNAASVTKDFVLTVLADPVDALAAIVITGEELTYDAQTQVYTAINDVVLPETIMGMDITWASGNAAVIANDGTVVRPAWSTPNSTVILTATIEDEEAYFMVTVLAIIEKPVDIILDDAFTILLLAGDVEGTIVTGHLDLATVVGSEGVTVTWASSNTDAILANGLVTRPAFEQDDAMVTLTATLHKGDQSLDKVFELTVLARVTLPGAVHTIASANALAVAAEIALTPVPVTLLGLTVFGINVDGFYAADATGISFFYTNSAPSSKLTIGEVYDFEAFTDIYYDAYQFTSISDAPITFVPSSASATEITYPVKTIATIMAYPKPNIAAPLVTENILITGRVLLSSPTGSYNTFIVPTTEDGALDKNEAIMIYYKSNKAAIAAYVDQVITVPLTIHAYRTNDLVWTAVYMGDGSDIVVVPMSDAEKLAAVKSSFAISLPAIQYENTTLVLPVEKFGATIVWTSSNNALIDPATGVVTRVEGQQTAVTLTATITIGGVPSVATYVVKVGEIALSTVAQMIAAPVSSTLLRVRGIVTASEYQNTYFIQDATGGIAVYIAASAPMELIIQGAYGKEIEIIGTRAVFGSLRQIAPTEIKVIGTATMPTPVDVDAIPLNATDMLPYQGQLISMTKMLVTAKAVDSYGNITLTLKQVLTGSTIQMKWDSRVTLNTAASTLLNGIVVGNAFDLTNPLAWTSVPYLYFTNSTILTAITLSDADLVAADLSAITVVSKVTENGTITLPVAGANGTTIAWASSDDLVITSAGVVTVPASGIATVTLTATVTKGLASEEKEFIVVVGMTDLEKATADAAELSIPAALIDATPITAMMPALGTKGSTITWATDNAALVTIEGVVTLPLVGQETVTLTATVTLGTETVVKEFVVAVGVPPAPTFATDLIISEYIEGSSNNKAIEIYNGTGAPVDLAGYSMNLYSNGSAVATALHTFPAYTLAHGEVYIIANSSAIASILAVANESLAYNATTPTLPNWNGDDAIALLKAGVVIDVFGVIGTDPGASWPVGTFSTVDYTLVRKFDVTEPTTTWDVTQWDVYPKDTVSYLGTHDMNIPTLASDLFISEYIEGSSNNKAIEVYNGTGAPVDLSIYKLVLYTNGTTTPGNTYVMTGTLADGDVFIIYNSSAVVAISSVGDVASNVTFYNGDDVVVLTKNDVIIDMFGVLGVDPGTNWAVGTGFTSEYTLVRKSSVTGPAATWDPTEWDVLPVDTFTELGTHTME